MSIVIIGIVLISAMLIIMGVVGFALGAAFTAQQRGNFDQPSNEPPLIRDLSNPYAPSSVGGRPTKRSPTGLAIAVSVLFIFGICVLAFAATYFLTATSTVKTAPMPPAPVPATPPPVVQKQPPPTSPE